MAVKSTDHLQRTEGLEINIVDDGFVVYQLDRDRLHYLNHIAGVILELSNGDNTEADIVTLLRDVYRLADDPAKEVAQGIELLRAQELIR